MIGVSQSIDCIMKIKSKLGEGTEPLGLWAKALCGLFGWSYFNFHKCFSFMDLWPMSLSREYH